MRSSAAEASVAPRAKQATPPASSGESAGPVGGQPPTHTSRPSTQQSHTGRALTQIISKNTPNSSSRSHHSKKSSLSSKSSSVPVPVIQNKTPTKSSPVTPSKTPTTPKTPNSLKRSSSTEGPKPPSSGSKHPQQDNFGEYDEPEEWGVNVGHLIIDLDADIAQADKGKTPIQLTSMNASDEKPNLKMKIKRTKPSTKTSEAKHVIVKSEAPGTPNSTPPVIHNSTAHHNGSGTKSIDASSPRTPMLPRSTYKKEKRRLDVNGSSSPTRSKTPPNGPLSPEKEIRARSDSQSSETSSQPGQNSTPRLDGPPLSKRQKMAEPVETKDVCIGTSVGTITEPESLGPCEPGTNVTLEGIVWHETDAGVLVVNVTWRGKTYVGSLIDCTKHDWAPPRLSDSPTIEETKTPKGRGKRGRAAAGTTTPGPELNVAETRSGKLRNANKGRRGLNSSTFPNTPENSPKSDGSSLKRKFGKDQETVSDTKSYKKSRTTTNKSSNCSSTDPNSPTSDIATPDTMDHEDTPVSTPPQPPTSPNLLPCDKPNCLKKFTNIHALHYHQTSAHKNITNDTNKENCTPDDSSVDTANSLAEETSRGSPIVETHQPDTLGLNNDKVKGSDRSHSMENQTDAGAVHELKRSIGMSHLPGSPLPNRTPMPFGHVPKSPGSPTRLAEKGDDEHKTVLVGPGGRPPLTQIDNPPSQNSLVGVPQATALSDLPGTPSNEPANEEGVLGKEADSEAPAKSPSREDARSPAYSDISDANEPAPLLESTLDTKDGKRIDLPLGPLNPSNYGLYYGGFGPPPHPYLMSPLPPNSPNMMKPDAMLEKGSEKDKKDGLPIHPPPDYLNRNPQLMFPYGLYPGGYPPPYRQDVMYKDSLDKGKLAIKDMMGDDAGDKGPTDLSKSSSQPNGSDKLKDLKSDSSSIAKDIQDRAEKRPMDPLLPLRYPGSVYEGRVPMVSPSNDKTGELRPSSLGKPPTPVPLSSPRLGPTPPNTLKEEKSDKQPDSAKSEGVKPTMETTGPPPPPTSSTYFSQFPYPTVPFDPYRPPMVPAMSLPSGFPSPYLPSHPSIGQLRYPLGVPSSPEDLSRSGSSNLLAASGLYPHKLAELQDRAQKSPVSMMQPPFIRNSSPIAYTSKESSFHSTLHPSSLSSSTQSVTTTSAIPSTTFASLHIPMSASNTIDRKAVPYPSLPEALPYQLMSPQFSPHFPGKN